MTRAKRISLPVLLTVSVVASVCICSAGGYVQPASLKQSERETAEQHAALLENKSHVYRYYEGATSYKLVTGKQADYTNLVQSLRSPKAIGRFAISDSRLPTKEKQRRQGLVRYGEESLVVNRTLIVIIESGRAFPELANEIARCYMRSEEWNVRFLCAQVLQQSKATPDIRMFVRDLAARTDELKKVARDTAEWDELETIFVAMKRLVSKGYQFPELTNVINRCYQANEDLGVRLLCRSAMERYDKEAAERFVRDEMQNPESWLSVRLSLAKDFLGKGDLCGYPVLREGLLWRHDGNEYYDQAIALLDGFRAFDGKPYDSSGRRVDIRALLRESAATNELVACQIRNEYLDYAKNKPAEMTRKQAPDIVRNTSQALWVRIVYAEIFAEDMGWLIGYPVLREGLLSRDDYTRKKALELLDLFRKHDGQPYDDENHMIDIQALLREVETAKQGKAAPES